MLDVAGHVGERKISVTGFVQYAAVSIYLSIYLSTTINIILEVREIDGRAYVTCTKFVRLLLNYLHFRSLCTCIILVLCRLGDWVDHSQVL